MVGHAKSETKKQQNACETEDELMARAVIAYRIKLKKTPSQQPKGARTICSDFKDLCRLETGITIKLSHTTLIHLTKGGWTCTQANADRTWVTREEEKVVIGYIVEIGNRGFPLSH